MVLLCQVAFSCRAATFRSRISKPPRMPRPVGLTASYFWAPRAPDAAWALPICLSSSRPTSPAEAGIAASAVNIERMIKFLRMRSSIPSDKASSAVGRARSTSIGAAVLLTSVHEGPPALPDPGRLRPRHGGVGPSGGLPARGRSRSGADPNPAAPGTGGEPAGSPQPGTANPRADARAAPLGAWPQDHRPRHRGGAGRPGGTQSPALPVGADPTAPSRRTGPLHPEPPRVLAGGGAARLGEPAGRGGPVPPGRRGPGPPASARSQGRGQPRLPDRFLPGPGHAGGDGRGGGTVAQGRARTGGSPAAPR